MSAAPPPLILVVEDDADVCTVLCTFLEDIQHRVAVANDRSTGAEILEKLNPALLIVDIMLQGGNGNDLAKLARAKNIPVLLMSGEPEHRTASGRKRPIPAKTVSALRARAMGQEFVVPAHDDEPPWISTKRIFFQIVWADCAADIYCWTEEIPPLSFDQFAR